MSNLSWQAQSVHANEARDLNKCPPRDVLTLSASRLWQKRTKLEIETKGSFN